MAALAIGAIACSGDEGDGDGDGATATEPLDTPEPTSAGQTPGPTSDATDEAGAATLEATENATLGTILTDADGNTLYRFDNDTAGVSACNEGCASLWPALTSSGQPTAGSGVTGTLGTIERDDGSTQVTYDDQPLYRYSQDQAAGDTNGDGFGGLWHVVELGG